MLNVHPIQLMLDYITGAELVRPNGNGERFPEMELAALQALSRPNALVRWWRARQEEQKRIKFLALLSQLSPHLLDDIGMKWTAIGGFEPVGDFMPSSSADQVMTTPADYPVLQVQLQEFEAIGRAA